MSRNPVGRYFFLGRRSNGTSMLTYMEPVRMRRYGSREEELYIAPGEPIAVQNLCENGVMALFGVLPEKLTWIKVRLNAEIM